MLPVQITVRDIPNSSALEDHIRKKAQKLNQYYQRINSCRIVITLPQKHKHQGKLYSVCIDLTVPGKELVVNHKLDEDIYIAIRDAFHALQRQLESYARKQRGNVKSHKREMYGVIERLFINEGYGFIKGIDGNEYYFSISNTAYPNFNHFTVGDSVEFISVAASDGLQANHVKREKHNHLLEEVES